MKNKINKRIAITFIMMILFAMFFKGQVFAITDEQAKELDNSMKNGTTLNVSTWNSNDNTLNINEKEDIFCIEGDKKLETELKYKVTNKIIIDGNEAKVYTGTDLTNPVKTVKDDYWCRIMGYILNQPEDRNNMFNQGTSQYSQKQMWYWMNFKNWVNEMGLNNALKDVNYSTYSQDEYWNLLKFGYIARGEQLNAKAINYANKYKDNNTNKANIENVTTSSPKFKAETNYNIVGPFMFKYDGNIDKITITDLNNNDITNKVKYGVYNGTKLEIVDSIPNNKNFYICLGSNESITGLGKIYVKVSKNSENGYSGSIWTLKADYTGEYPIENTQQIIATTGGTSNTYSEKDIIVDVNMPFTCELQIRKVDEKNNKVLPGITFKIYKYGEGWLKIDKRDNKVVGYTENFEDISTNIVTLDGGLTPIISNVSLSGKYMIVETDLGPYKHLYKLKTFYTNGKQESGTIIKDGYTLKPNNQNLVTVTANNEQEYGRLQIEKIDLKTGKKLKGIGFKIYEKDIGWIVTNDTYYVTGSGKYDDATIFYTDKNGKTPVIDKLMLDLKYEIYEVYLPEDLSKLYGLDYINVPGKAEKVKAKLMEGNVVLNSGISGTRPVITTKTETNEQKYIALSGYVWQDITGNYDNKTEQEANGIFDTPDYKLNGVTVVLKDKQGNIVKDGDGNECKTVTKEVDGKNGYYRFEKIEIEQIEKDNYYVEFTYDGLTYQSVVPQIDKDEGSKASETQNSREEFNNMFSEITGKGQQIDGHEMKYETKTENGITQVTLTNTRKISSKVEKQENNPNSENVINISSMGDFTINSTTTSAGFKIAKRYEELKKQADAKKELVTEITNINLGLYERPQTDISLVKDVYSAKMSINGFNHIYEYGKYFNYLDEPRQESDFNVAVQWKKERTGTYTGPIYRSDINYENEDKNKELKAAITYAIDIRNENTNTDRTIKVNSIVDYFDTKYETSGIKVGTSINEETGEVIGDLNVSQVERVNDKYNKITIDTSKLGEIAGTGENHKTIYVKFDLSKAQIAEILKGEEANAPLDNVVEIASYSTIQNGKPYAAIDKDSIPNNIEIDKKETYNEDDTDKAPSFVLHAVDDRTLSGTVFVDNAETYGKGNVRQGNGKYDEGESAISGVKVIMTEVDKDGNKLPNGKTYESATNENGEFTITGYTPAYYTISYEWGEQQGYDVKEYKGTVVLDTDRFNKTDWYKTEEPRYSDAMDDYTTREKIDAGDDIKSMTSTTPVFGVGVDANGATDIDITTTSDGDQFVRQDSKYLDFGIIERAKQSLEISKTVDTVKITDASGRVLVDAQINSEGKLEGQISGVTGGPDLGYIKAEIDNEAIQGSVAQIGYKITVANNGELDYANKDFYLYGKVPANDADIIKLKATNIYDYLDNDMKLDDTRMQSSSENTSWKQLVTSEVVKKETPTLIEKYFMSSITSETLDDGTVLVKGLEEIQSETMKKLFQEWYTETYTTNTTTETNKLTQIRALKLDDRQVLEIESTALSPKDNPLVYNLYSTSMLSNSDEIRFDNETEISDVEIYKNSNNKLEKVPGRSIDVEDSKLYDKAEWVTVTPPTGENKDYTMIIVSSISAIVILAAGIVFIKKKVLK